MINCEVIQDLMPLYADCQISPSGKQLVDDHNKTCPECNRLLHSMLAPVELESNSDDSAYLTALRKQKKRQTRRTFIRCILPVLILIFAWWIYMETHFYGETPYIVTTDEEIIFSEVPELILMDAELSQANAVISHPAFQDALSSGKVTEIPPEQVPDLIAAIIPQGTTVTNIAILSSGCVCLDYHMDDLRIILEYIDTDQTGTVDLIRKTIGVSNRKGEADTVYTMDYAVGIGRYWCEKQKLRHMWFSFISIG